MAGLGQREGLCQRITTADAVRRCVSVRIADDRSWRLHVRIADLDGSASADPDVRFRGISCEMRVTRRMTETSMALADKTLSEGARSALGPKPANANQDPRGNVEGWP